MLCAAAKVANRYHHTNKYGHPPPKSDLNNQYHATRMAALKDADFCSRALSNAVGVQAAMTT